MSETIRYAKDNLEQVYLVGVRLRSDSDEPDLYTLVLYNEVARDDSNRPLTQDGRILFFRSPLEANRALALGDSAFRKYKPIGSNVTYIYDLPKVLDLVSGADRDEPGVIADFINELLDLVAATRWPLPAAYRKRLFELADQTTFDKDLTGLYGGDSDMRAEARDALLWCVGAVLTSARVLR